MIKKRFTMKGSTIFECGEEITAWDCCDLLNELHKENQIFRTFIELNDFDADEIIRQGKGVGMTEYEKWLYDWYFDMLKHYGDKRKVERRYKYKRVDFE